MQGVMKDRPFSGRQAAGSADAGLVGMDAGGFLFAVSAGQRDGLAGDQRGF